MTNLTDEQTLRHLLTQAGVEPTRTLGQNFLICSEPIEAVLAALDNDVRFVTELGSGAGPLTQALLAAGFTVRAIERDRRLSKILKTQTPTRTRDSLELLVGDLREISWQHTDPYHVVGNIPYSLSGYILRRLTQLSPIPVSAVLMVQQEVAERIVAKPPHMNLLGLAVQLWAEPHYLMRVPATCFWPAPAVDSALVLLLPRTGAATVTSREAVLSFAKPFFQAKRKQIGGTLRRSLSLTASDVETILTSASLDPALRPQHLSVSEWQTFYLEAKKQVEGI